MLTTELSVLTWRRYRKLDAEVEEFSTSESTSDLAIAMKEVKYGRQSLAMQ